MKFDEVEGQGLFRDKDKHPAKMYQMSREFGTQTSMVERPYIAGYLLCEPGVMSCEC